MQREQHGVLGEPQEFSVAGAESQYVGTKDEVRKVDQE